MPKRRGDSASDTTEIGPKEDALLVRFVELLSNEVFVQKLRQVINPKPLTNKLDTLTKQISQLNERLEKKDKYIAALEARLSSCETDLDQLEQYSRRTNLRFFGIPESETGENTNGKLLSIVNESMGVTPPIVSADVVTSHRLGRRVPGADIQTRPRPVIVKFATAHVRDVVIRARRRLRESGDGPTVYVNEDLTRRRAALAKKTRQLKKSRKINDCWTFNGKVVVKTIDGVMKEIRSDVDLTGY